MNKLSINKIYPYSFPRGKIVNVVGNKTDNKKPSEKLMILLAKNYIERHDCNYVFLYDENGNIIKRYSKEELED